MPCTLGAQGNIKKASHPVRSQKTGLRVRVPGTLALLQPHHLGERTLSAQARAAPWWCGLVCAHPHPGTSELGPPPRVHLEGGEGELRGASLAERSTPGRARPSRSGMTSCVPSRGMSVPAWTWRAWGDGAGTSFWTSPWTLLPLQCSQRPARPGTWVTEPSPPECPGTGCLEGRK